MFRRKLAQLLLVLGLAFALLASLHSVAASPAGAAPEPSFGSLPSYDVPLAPQAITEYRNAGQVVMRSWLDQNGQKVTQRIELGKNMRTLEEVMQDSHPEGSGPPIIATLYSYERGGTYQGGIQDGITAEDINSDSRPEILYSGYAIGPLYAYDLDGNPIWNTGSAQGAVHASAIPGSVIMGINRSYLTDTIRILNGQGQTIAFHQVWNYISDPATVIGKNFCIGEQDFRLHCYSFGDDSVTPTWTSGYFNGQRVETGAIGDFDNDEQTEIVVGENGSSGGQDIRAFDLTTGNLHWSHPAAGIGKEAYPGLWTTAGDLNGDNNLEIAYVTRITQYPWTPKIRLLSNAGNQAWEGTPINDSSYGNGVAIGDLNCEDGRGIPELATLTEGGIDVFTWDTRTMTYTEAPGWPVSWDDGQTWDGNWSVTFGDVNNDGFQEVIAGSQVAGSALYGELRVYSRSGELLYGPYQMELGDGGTPAVVYDPVRGRNLLVVKASPWDGYSGWKATGYVFDFGGSSITANPVAAWSQFQHDAAHSGLYQPTPCFVPQVADLAITKAAPTHAHVGDILTYTIMVTNTGPTTATNVIMTDTLPSGITYYTATSSCQLVGLTPAGGIVSCFLGDFRPDTTNLITIATSVGISGIMTNTAIVTSSVTDLNLANNTATAVTRVEPFCISINNIEVTATSPVTTGVRMTFTLVFTPYNYSPVDYRVYPGDGTEIKGIGYSTYANSFVIPYTYTTAGLYNAIGAGKNCDASEYVTDTVQVTVLPQWRRLYLPLLLRNG